MWGRPTTTHFCCSFLSLHQLYAFIDVPIFQQSILPFVVSVLTCVVEQRSGAALIVLCLRLSAGVRQAAFWQAWRSVLPAGLAPPLPLLSHGTSARHTLISKSDLPTTAPSPHIHTHTPFRSFYLQDETADRHCWLSFLTSIESLLFCLLNISVTWLYHWKGTGKMRTTAFEAPPPAPNSGYCLLVEEQGNFILLNCFVHIAGKHFALKFESLLYDFMWICTFFSFLSNTPQKRHQLLYAVINIFNCDQATTLLV